MNVNDNEMQEKISAFIDGELTQQEAQKVELQIQSSESYQAIMNEYMVLKAGLQNIDNKFSVRQAEDLLQRVSDETDFNYAWFILIFPILSSVFLLLFGGSVSFASLIISSAVGLLVLVVKVIYQQIRSNLRGRYRKVNL